ncbi:unnamed protein product [Schistocephalus solidus]|uniref:Uncharacterized protein n=1 Tax=Schistocephalus solidus TaxID=70667 RepID=A0A3P7D4B0_SCHSO|nr:unnamed protein product [Schistocephalus solidus]
MLKLASFGIGPDEPGVGQAGAKSLPDLFFLDLFLFGFTNSPTLSTSNVGATSISVVVMGNKARLMLMLPELSADGVEQGLDGAPFESSEDSSG